MQAIFSSRLLMISLTALVVASSMMSGAAEADQVLISAGTGAKDDIRNGGFESTDNNKTFYSRWRGTSASDFDSESWRNYRFPQAREGRNDGFTPPEGRYRGLVNSITAGANAGNGSEPSVDTGHTIRRGDKFTLSFKYAGALGWTKVTGLRVIASLYYDDDGNYQDGKDKVIDNVTVTPRSNATNNEAYVFSGNLTLEATPDSVEKVARLRFQTNLDRNIYAVIDDVSLKVSY